MNGEKCRAFLPAHFTLALGCKSVRQRWNGQWIASVRKERWNGQRITAIRHERWNGQRITAVRHERWNGQRIAAIRNNCGP